MPLPPTAPRRARTRRCRAAAYGPSPARSDAGTRGTRRRRTPAPPTRPLRRRGARARAAPRGEHSRARERGKRGTAGGSQPCDQLSPRALDVRAPARGLAAVASLERSEQREDDVARLVL